MKRKKKMHKITKRVKNFETNDEKRRLREFDTHMTILILLDPPIPYE